MNIGINILQYKKGHQSIIIILYFTDLFTKKIIL